MPTGLGWTLPRALDQRPTTLRRARLQAIARGDRTRPKRRH